MLRRFLEVRTLAVAISALLTGSVFGQAGVRINEVMANNESFRNSDESITDWVELHNTTGAAVDLSGASLTDNASTPREWVFPEGVSIPANGYLVVVMDSSVPPSTSAGALLNTGFALSASGETLYFFGRGTPGALLDSITFGIQAVDFSLGRVGAGWALTEPTAGAANVAATLGNVGALRVNEWMADPESGDDWFEIFNTGDNPIALGGLYLTDDVGDKQKSLIPPHSYIGIGLNAFVEIFADGNPENGADHADFSLGAGGDRIGIYTASGTQIDLVQFGAQEEGISQGRLPDGSANIVTFDAGAATPGEPNFRLLNTLWINEILTHTDPPYEDAVEIYNPGTQPVDISGWYLSDSNARLQKWQIPSNTTVPAGGYVVFYQHQFNGAGAAEPFAFSANGDDVYLAQAVGGQLTGFVVREEFEAAPNAISFGRVETSVAGDYKFVALQSPTFGVNNPGSVEQFRTGQGAANTGPLVGPIVINEIMFHPQTNAATDNVLDEYIELYNISGAPVQLFDPLSPENRWRLRDAVGLTFPQDTTIPANGYALAVSFDPIANAAQANAFRTKYNVPASVPLFGPYTGKLGNEDDGVEFYRPDRPDGDDVPYLRVDKVNYSSTAPWPTGAAATGLSIQRVDPAAFGNDPANWEAAEPTAGRSNSPETPAFEITAINVVAGRASVTFESVPGTTYSLQVRNSFADGTEWQTISSILASSSSTTLQDTGTGIQRFFRVVAGTAN